MSVVASYNQAAGRIEPYVSLDEVKFSATAAAIDLTNLIENATQAVQDRALSELIVRASAKADVYTMGQYGTMNATVNTENGRYRPNRYGQIIVNPHFSPIIAVNSFSCGYGPGIGLQPVTLTADNTSIERNEFIVTYASSVGLTTGPLSIAGGNWAPNAQLFVEYSYTNGWANSFTTATTAAGSSSVTVLDATGIYPGMNLTVWDGMNDEYRTVASTYNVGDLTIPFTSPLSYKHGKGVNVSALPPTVKQAVIHFVVAMIKQRGQGGLVINEIGEPTAVSSRVENSVEDEIQAYDLLDAYRAIWGRA